VERRVSPSEADAGPVPPGAGDRVELRLPGREGAAAEVAAAAEGVLLIECDLPPASLKGEAGFVEFLAAEGMCQLPGLLSQAPRGPARFEHVGRVWVLRRRAFVRVALDAPVTLTSAERAAPAEHVRTVDVGGGGMLAQGVRAAPVGERVDFSLALDRERPPVRGEARVVRETGEGHRALQFTDLDAAEEDRLVHFLFALEVVRLRSGPGR
jgi:hypothetical protein